MAYALATVLFCLSHQTASAARPHAQAAEPVKVTYQTTGFVPRILFIDVNNAPAEVAAVRRAAGKQAHIDTWPTEAEISSTERKKVYDIGVKVEALQNTLNNNAVLCSSQPNSALCVKSWQALRTLEIERQALTQRVGLDSLKVLLSKVSAPYSMVVVSGHHENGFFEGELTRINLKEFQGVINLHASAFESVRSVLLLGCDTALDQMMQTRIRPIFPAAKVIIGAEGSAPTRNEPRNLKFIERVVKLEPQLVATQQASFIKNSVANLRAGIWPVAMLWGDVYSAGTDTERQMPLAKLMRAAAQKQGLEKQ